MKLISKKVWNLPNSLTIFRILLIPLFVYLMYIIPRDIIPAGTSGRGRYIALNLAASLLYLIAVTTDFIDGYIARRYKIVTPVGQLLDPLADKLLVSSALIMLSWDLRVSPWVAIVIIGRELAVTGLRGITSMGGVIVPASNLGKWKMTIQSIGIIGLIWNCDYFFGLTVFGVPLPIKLSEIIIYIAVVITLWSGYDYFAKFIDMATAERPDTKGDGKG